MISKLKSAGKSIYFTPKLLEKKKEKAKIISKAIFYKIDSYS